MDSIAFGSRMTVSRIYLKKKKAWRRMNLPKPWLWKTNPSISTNDPRPLLDVSVRLTLDGFMKIFQIFGFENKS